MNKIVIIGCGNVGMSYAYALLNQKVNVNELVLIDKNEEKVLGEVMDLNHCLAFAPNKINIKTGTYKDVKNADIIVIAAGANQEVGETRLDLIHKNSVIFKSIIDEVMRNGFNGIFLIATNPVDIMTMLTHKYSSLPTSKVIGTGTSLDTARLRYMVADKLSVNPKNVHAYVIGEHGDSEFALWSTASIGLQPIDEFLTETDKTEIENEVRNAAYEIIKRKGATCYGIGMCLVRITNAILGDENSVITVSGYDKDNDVYFGMPAIINKDGVKDRIWLKLQPNEEEQLTKSIKIIKDAMKDL